MRSSPAHRTIRREDALQRAQEVAAGLADRADEADRTGTFPGDDVQALRQAGLLGLMVPERLGGAGAGFADYAEVAMALAAGSGSTALIFNMHASVTGALALTPDDLALALGVPESYFAVRDDVLGGALQGAMYSVAMSERGAGSRLSEMTTRYRAAPDGWLLTGSKAFCSGSTLSLIHI